MKPYLICIVLIVGVASGVHAQNPEIPQKEFILKTHPDSIRISGGDSAVIDVVLLKSKGVAKSKGNMTLSSFPPKGVTVVFNPEKGVFDTTKAIFSVAPGAPPGTYNLIVSATVNYKTKGVIVKLVIL
jgi:hypothetical protein